MNDSVIAPLRTALLAWYDNHARDLPWRSEAHCAPDPYRVWLSEIMLQQTRVDTVRPYFVRWLERFPTLAAVAEAPLDDVLKEWEGLGYYSRARNFHRAAREVHEHYGGVPPADPESFRRLPGVGRYTAGAVMSIAFGREEPVVDGNVRRVLARWLDRAEPSEEELWGLTGRLVRGERPGCFNQALMELGATVCSRRAPRCAVCPVAAYCSARIAGTQEDRPLPKRRKPLPHEARVAVIVERDGQLLLTRSPLQGRLGGLWEFPGDRILAGETPEAAAERTLGERLGIAVAPADLVSVIDHTFTHLRVSYHALRADLLGGTARAGPYAEVRWISPEQLAELALPRAQRRIAAAARLQPMSVLRNPNS